MGTTSVDPHALRLAAQRLDAAADLLAAAVCVQLQGLPGSAALDRLLGDVNAWQRAARETAAAVRTGAAGYIDVEQHAVRRLR